jgi:hypothetical protein
MSRQRTAGPVAGVVVVALLCACSAAPTSPTPAPRIGAASPAPTTIVRVVYAGATGNAASVPPTPTASLPPTTVPAPTTVPPAPTPQRAGAAPVAVPPGDGTVLVGVDVAPGVYRSAPQTRTTGTVRTCSWERLSGTTGALGDTIASDRSDGPSVVTILPTDVAFRTQFCGSWTRVG